MFFDIFLCANDYLLTFKDLAEAKGFWGYARWCLRHPGLYFGWCCFDCFVICRRASPAWYVFSVQLALLRSERQRVR
jgi:hypothetical protein